MKVDEAFASPRFLRGLGFFLGTLLLVEINVVAGRHVLRGSFSAVEALELSRESQALFANVRDRIRVAGFVSKSDPHAETLTLVLESLRLVGVSVTTIDPDRERARFELAIEDEEFDDRIPLAIVTSDSGRVLVTGDSTPLGFSSLVEKLSRAASEVTREGRKKLCFSEGHGERSPGDSSPGGASHFAALATQSNVEVETTFGDALEKNISSCSGIVVLGQTQAFASGETEILARGLAAGIPLALFVDPITGPEKRIEKSGLEPLLTTLGIALKNNVVLEHDAARRPQGEGEETFFPSASDHPISSAPKELGPAFTFARELELLPNGLGIVLFRSSENSTTATRLQGEPRAIEEGHSSIVAVAVEAKTNLEKPVRAAVFGTSSPFANLALNGDSGRAHRALARRTLGFLLGEKIAPAHGDETSQESEPLSEDFVRKLIAFVLVVEPLFLLGAFVAFAAHRRAKREESSS